MNNKQKERWIVDAILFGGLLVLFFLDLTGVDLHQWIGLFAGGLALYHLASHWNWVTAITERFFEGSSNRARLYYVLDGALFAGFALMILTGLVISTWLNLTLSSYAAWLSAHIWISIATLGLVVVKIGLHWRWVASVALSLVREMQPAEPVRVAARSQPGGKRMTRREFLGVMGLVSVVSTAALNQAVHSLDASEQSVAQTSSTTNIGTTSSSGSSQTVTSSSGCTVRCGRGCSYPGHCRKYVDTNGNNRCDLGECM